MGQASRDGNFVPTLIGVSSGDGSTPVTVYVDPTTHRLLVSLPAGNNFADSETPTGTINGSNVTFTLANTVSPAASLELFLNGVLQTAGGVDYTLSGLTITYVLAPPSGSSHRAWYRY